MDNLTKAKANIILDHPFFASLLLGMEIKEDEVPTIGTNGDDIIYSKDYLADKSLGNHVFLLAHEIMHCVFEHVYRRNGRDVKKWNQACDYIVNDMLIKEGIGTIPENGLHNPQLVASGNGTAEGVYNLLPDDPKGNENAPGAGEPGGSLDEMKDPEGDEATKSQKEAEMKVKIAQAANAAKMCGKLSVGIERLVREATKSKVDWKSVLRKFFTEIVKNTYSYARPKRRFLAEDIYLPGLTGDNSCGEIVIPVDCSGSINEEVLQVFSAEIKGIIEDVKPKKVHVVYFDSQVLKHDIFEIEEEFQIKAVGGGGTAFSPVFKYINENIQDVKACVFLTDLCCDDFGKVPDYPVLWVSTALDEAPFGEVIKIN